MPEKVEYELSLKDLLTKNLQAADAMANKFESTMNRIGTGIATYFTADAIINFGQKMMNAGTMVENARTGLTTLLHDANAASEVIKNTMQDASSTPFAFEGLLSANKALISAGVDAKTARQDVLNLANAIAATGGGDVELQRMVVNMQQIKNTGKATALDIKQFAYAGVNIYAALAAATGKPIEKVKDMEVSYDMLTLALRKAHEQGGIYANGLENMQKNTSVRISNLGDNVFQFMVKMFDSLKPIIDPILDGLNDGIQWISNKYTEFAPQITAFAQGVMSVFKQVIDFLQPLFEPIKRMIHSVWDAIQRVMKALEPMRPLFNAIGSAARDALGWLFDILGEIFEVVGKVTLAISNFLDSLGVFDALKGMFDGVWTVVKWIADKLAWIYNHTIKPIVEGIGWAVDKINSITRRDESKTADAIGHQHYQALMDQGKMTWDQVLKELGEERAYATFPERRIEKKMGSDIRIGSAFGTSSAPTDVKKGNPSTTGNVPSLVEPKNTATGGAKPARATTIHVNIGDLIKNFTVSTTNLTESKEQVKAIVTELLMDAVMDAETIADKS